jgi:uncharacterized protein (TIGR03435 family)
MALFILACSSRNRFFRKREAPERCAYPDVGARRFQRPGPVSPETATIDDLHEMFKTLLADRFKLRFHTESRELTRLALRLDASGVKMKRNESPNRHRWQ